MSQFPPLSQADEAAALRTVRVPGVLRDATVLVVPIAIVGAIVLRIVLLFRYRINTDETQHLHVIWGWTHGLLPYRDLFDNHMPLFHILAVPLLRLAGERPETLLLARISMLPFFAAMALLTYQIALSCYPRRSAAWAALIGTLAPGFFLCSLEFRTDVLWAACWLGAIAILVRARTTPWRAAGSGLALGLAAAISAKTWLLVASVAVAALITFLVTHQRKTIREVATSVVTFTFALLLPTAIIAAYFFAQGAWGPFVYATLTHNVVGAEHPYRIFYLPIFVAIIVAGTRRLMHGDVPAEVRRRRLFIFLTAAVYATVLISLWPLIEDEHWLPFYPIAAAALVPWMISSSRLPRAALALLALELFWIIRTGTPWRDRVAPSTALIDQAMTLTTPRETVADLKGEVVFRTRAFFYVLEKLTKRAIASGRLQDTIAADILRNGTMVAVPDNPGFPPKAREFLLRNFVRVGCVRVAGKIAGGRELEIEIPAEYAVVSERGEFRGAIDGTLYTGPRFLTPGKHTLASDGSSGRAAVIWQRAAALGFSPFVTDERCLDDSPVAISGVRLAAAGAHR